MPRRVSAILLAVAALGVLVAAVLALFATCSPEDAGIPVAERESRPGSAAANDWLDGVRPAASPPRVPRKRAAAPEPPAAVNPLTAAGPSNEPIDALRVEWESNPALVSAALADPDTLAPPPATGRVRVLFLKDGKPFAGGHVCFTAEATYNAVKSWDGTSTSDLAYGGVPMTTALWPNFEPVLGSADGAQHFEEPTRGVTDKDGVVTLDMPADKSLVPYIRWRSSGIPLLAQPRVTVTAGGETRITLEAAPQRTLTGRCVDTAGRPLAGIWVQALAASEERPLSLKGETSAAGAFQLEVFGADTAVRVRAIVPTFAHPLGIYDSEADVPPIPAETTVSGVVPGGAPTEIRMPDALLVFVEVTVAGGEAPLGALQVEGLAYDPRAGAWGRLGGPKCQRAPGPAGGRRAVIALPREEADRPLMLWSWGFTLTVVDPRGADRIAVEIPRGRRVSVVRGRGWKSDDRLRVLCFCGPAGAEIPCIWLDGSVETVAAVERFTRDDAPPCAIEFQVVRDGVVVGRSARVPPGTGAAADVSIDIP